MLRFLFLGFPLVLLALAGFHFVVDALDLDRPDRLPERFVLALWLLEAAGLVSLFVLVRERTLNRWMAGLATGWVAWIFRGPVLVLTVFGITDLTMDAWWNLSVGWLVLYTVCGLAMAAVAHPLGADERTDRRVEVVAGPGPRPADRVVEGPPPRPTPGVEGPAEPPVSAPTPPAAHPPIDHERSEPSDRERT